MLRPAFAALSAIVLVAGCSGPASVKQAREGVDTFHANFNSGNFQAIWDSSSFDLKNTTTPPQFFQLGRRRQGELLQALQMGFVNPAYFVNAIRRAHIG